MKENKNKKLIVIIALIAAAVIIAAIAIGVNIYNKSNKDDDLSSLGTGDKNITVEVLISEDDIRVYRINTSADTLLEAMKEQNLIDGEQQDYGYYITAIDGIQADETQNQWWCLIKNDVVMDVNIQNAPIVDGDKFTLRFMKDTYNS